MHMIAHRRHHTILEPIIEDAPSLAMPISLDSSNFWRLHSKAWMKSSPFAWPYTGWRCTSSSSISKSDVTPRVNMHICAIEVMSIESSTVSEWQTLLLNQHRGKGNFNIFWNVSYPLLFCHSVQTDGLEFFSQLVQQNFVTQQVNNFVQNGLQ